MNSYYTGGTGYRFYFLGFSGPSNNPHLVYGRSIRLYYAIKIKIIVLATKINTIIETPNAESGYFGNEQTVIYIIFMLNIKFALFKPGSLENNILLAYINIA